MCSAILGTIDGANSHIAIRVALKAEVVMMNSGDTDPTFIETNIPWTMRCIGDDRQMGYLLIDYMLRKMGHKRIGIIRSSATATAASACARSRTARGGCKHPVIIEMAYKVGSTDFSLQIERLKASKLDAVVHWGDGSDGALILNQMRQAGMNQPFYGSDRTVIDGVRADGRRERRGRDRGLPLGSGPARSRSSWHSANASASASAMSRRPTRHTATTA